MKDPVNHPPHYEGKVECIDALETALTPEEFKGFCKGNALKYVFRANRKNKEIEDLKKSVWYLQRIIKRDD